MDAKTLLNLCRSWRELDCPNEILLDAIMDMGIDVEIAFSKNMKDSVRYHVICCGKQLINEEISKRVRNDCWAVKEIEAMLKGVQV